MFIAEFKKLWQPVLFVVAIAFSLVYYRQSLDFVYEYFPNGYLIPHFQYASKWQEKYGNKLTAENWQEVQQDHQALILEVNQMLVDSKLAQENDISTFEEFNTLLDKRTSQASYDELSKKDKKISDDYTAIYKSLVDREGNNLIQKITSFEYIQEGYDNYVEQNNIFQYQQLLPGEKERLNQQLFDSQENWRNILPVELKGTTGAHFNSVFFLLMVILSLLIPSVFVRDRLLGLTKSQWSSRKGRRLVGTQWRVSIVASLLIITGTVGLFVYKYYQTDFIRYFSSGLTSFLAESYPGDFSLLNLDFGQWFYLIVLITCLFSVAFAAVLFFYSQTSENYLSLILKIIPTMIVFRFLSSEVMKRSFLVNNPLYQKTRVPYIELYLTIAVLVVSLLLSFIPIYRSRKEELLD